MRGRAFLSTRELVAFGAGGLTTLALVSLGPLHARVVPSASMAPTLMPGDRLAILDAQPPTPARGEIVVFRAPFKALPGAAPAPKGPFSEEPLYIKRVVGLPGDTVAVIPGRGVRVNGHLLAEPYVQAHARYAWGPAAIPSGRVFVLGDNRNDSFDSHHWGLLPVARIVGRPAALFWPPRRSRLF